MVLGLVKGNTAVFKYLMIVESLGRYCRIRKILVVVLLLGNVAARGEAVEAGAWAKLLREEMLTR